MHGDEVYRVLRYVIKVSGRRLDGNVIGVDDTGLASAMVRIISSASSRTIVYCAVGVC